MRLPDAQLELLRTRPHQTELFMSIFQPQIIMKCRLNNASAAKGDRTIPYDDVTLGDYSLVDANFTMKVGSYEEGDDLGKIRIRSAESGYFIVSENSNVAWDDDAYLTIYRFVELNPIYPRIIQNPADDEDVIFYKDWDVPYSNQNSVLGTFICMGPDRALFKGEQSYYSATGTFNPLGDFLSYSWSFDGGIPSGSASETPGFVTYPTPGHYVAKLIVSGSSGGVDTSYRCVSVYDKPGEGASNPVKRWELTGLGGSRDEGGYQASFRVYDDISVEENSVIVLFADDWYGNINQSIGGNSPGNEKIFFVGRVLDGTIQYDYKKSYVEFTVGSLTEVMKNALSFSVSVESKLSPSTWYELYDMDCRRAIYHYLKWHSTALNIADLQFKGTDYPIQFFDADRTSMFDAIDNLMRNTLLGKVVSDRQGKIWVEVDAEARCPRPLTPFITPPVVNEFTKRDWMGEPSIEERRSDSLSYYEAGGIAYSGVHTGTFAAILSSAPGSTPSFRGTIDMSEGLALQGQNQLNELTGNIFANRNTRYPKITMELMGNYRNIDIAPQEAVKMTIEEEDTVANVAIDGYYIPNSIDWKYDSRNKILLAERVDFSNVVNGSPGETVEMAEEEDDGYDIPQLQIPPLPSLTIPPMLAGLITGTFSQSMVDNSIANYETNYFKFLWRETGGIVTQYGKNFTVVAITDMNSASQDPSLTISTSKSGLFFASFNISTSCDVPTNATVLVGTTNDYVSTIEEREADEHYNYHWSGVFKISGENFRFLFSGSAGGTWFLRTFSASIFRIGGYV